MGSQLFKLVCVGLTCLCMSAGTLAQQEPESVIVEVRILETPVGWGRTMAQRFDIQNRSVDVYHLNVSKISLRQEPLLQLAQHDLEASLTGRVIASPRMMTWNGVTARMQQGVEIPYADASVPVSLRNVGLLTFTMTPNVISGQRVVLQMQWGNASQAADGLYDIFGRPLPDDLLHTVVLGQGETVMFSNMYRFTENSRLTELPRQWQRLIGERHLPFEMDERFIKYMDRYAIELVLLVRAYTVN